MSQDGVVNSSTTHTDAGDYLSDPWSFAGNGNYNAANGTVDDYISQASSVTTVTCPANAAYTGAPIEPCSASVTGAGGLDQALTVGYTNNTDVGTANADASYAGDANHTGSGDSKTFGITKASSSVIVTCPASVTYDGSAQTPCTAEVTGAGALSEILTVDYTDNTNVGTANASAGYAGDANHETSSSSATFAINQASSEVTVTCPVSVSYNGSAQTPCSASVTGAGGLNQALTVTYSNNIKPGTAAASASYPGDANHDPGSSSTTFTITGTSSAPMCNGRTATIYVNAQGRIVGGPDNGKVYKGQLKGTDHQDVIVGSTRSDVIDAKGGNDVVCGGNGNDTLKGGTGNDRLFGDAGMDELNGDGHNDILTGGTNADKFNGGVGNDSATDFNPAKGDIKTSVEHY